MLIQNNIETIKGSKVVINTLKNLGVDTIFGYPGGIVLDLYDELYNQTDIKHILVRHEQAAVHAAEGYARTSGKCGVVLVTSGPGATNTVTGIVNAYLDGYPLVVLTGQVASNLIGKDAFQEANICDITKSCAKKTFQITKAENIQGILTEAFKIAMSGKKGPVVVDMAKDIFKQNAGFDTDLKIKIPANPEINFLDIKRVFNKILSSSKPVIVSGGGVVNSKAEKELLNFSKLMNIPVVTTMAGCGSYPKENNNHMGMIGIFGDNSANQLIKNSDLIISLGARFNDRITCMFDIKNLAEKFIQVDINKEEIFRVISGVDFICADIKDVLSNFNELLKTEKYQPFNKWTNEVQNLKSLNIKRKCKTNLIHSFEVIRILDNFTKDKDVIFTSEVGQHMLWAVQNLTLNRDRTILLSGGSGTMGFGFPAAIGAAVAAPEKTVVCIAGDGSFQMNLQELAVCRDYNLNIKIIILNNGYLGMVRQLQEKNYGARYSQTQISNPDFLKLAESYGIKSKRISSITETKDALSETFAENTPFVLDIMIEPMELL